MKLLKSSTDKLEEIYLLYEQKMYYLAFSVLKDTALAEDAVHDSILKIMNYLPKIKQVDSPECKSLVMKITKTTTIDMYRSLHKNTISFKDIDDEHLADDRDDIELCINSISARFIISQSIKDMPEALKEIVRLKYYCELSNREIAEILQVSMDVVRKRDERLKHFIKEKAGEDYEL